MCGDSSDGGRHCGCLFSWLAMVPGMMEIDDRTKLLPVHHLFCGRQSLAEKQRLDGDPVLIGTVRCVEGDLGKVPTRQVRGVTYGLNFVDLLAWEGWEARSDE